MKRLLIGALAMIPLCATAGPDDPIFTEGDWSAYKGDKNLTILTTDKKEGSGLGMVCGIESEKCSWSVLAAPGLCKVGDKTPILFTGAGIGGIASEMACAMSDDEATMFEIREFDEITAIVSGSDHVQIATPTESDGIVIVEYPTRGYVRAATKLQRAHPPKK
ncbi:TPA: hypothetical protein QEK98_002962 [Stenotrophomonas maltophilia]|nr:hypothetical protein [Stenotrophomonas maltophilia]